MKRYYEFNNEQLANLSAEEIQNLIDLECAMQGIQILPPKPKKPELVEFESDLRAYEVAGFFLKEHDEAVELLDILNSFDLFTKDYGSNELIKITKEDYRYPKLEVSEAYSPEYYSKIKAEKEHYEKIKEVYKSDTKIYEEAKAEIRKIEEEVLYKVDEAKQIIREVNNIKQLFNRYLKLADGDRAIAINFLKSVYDISQYEGLEEELINQEVEING